MQAEFWMVVTERLFPDGAPGHKLSYTLLHRGASAGTAVSVFKASAPPTWTGATILLQWSVVRGARIAAVLGRDGPMVSGVLRTSMLEHPSMVEVIDKAVEAYYMELFSLISHDGPICLADPIGECQVPTVVTPEPK